MGNSAGVIALVYNGINSYIGYLRGKREFTRSASFQHPPANIGSDDASNSIVAGALSGMIFKSTRGTKPMLISGGLVASAAGAWAVSHNSAPFDLPQC